MSTFNQNTIQSLIDAGVLSEAAAEKLQRKAVRIQKKAAKEARAEATLTLVRAAFEELTAEGSPTQHRAVWNKVGRQDFERDEVLQAGRGNLTDEAKRGTDRREDRSCYNKMKPSPHASTGLDFFPFGFFSGTASMS